MPKIKEVLAEKNISQNQLAKIIHEDFNSVTKVVINNICNYKVIPSQELLDKMCSILDCHTNDLYSFEELDFRNYFIKNRGGIPPLKLKSIEKIPFKIKNPYKLTVPIEKKDRDLLFNKDVLNRYGVRSITEFVRLIIKEKIEEVKENG